MYFICLNIWYWNPGEFFLMVSPLRSNIFAQVASVAILTEYIRLHSYRYNTQITIFLKVKSFHQSAVPESGTEQAVIESYS